MTEDQMRDRLKHDVEKTGGIRAWARVHGISPGEVSKALAGTISVPPGMGAALGYRLERNWQRSDNGNGKR